MQKSLKTHYTKRILLYLLSVLLTLTALIPPAFSTLLGPAFPIEKTNDNAAPQEKSQQPHETYGKEEQNTARKGLHIPRRQKTPSLRLKSSVATLPQTLVTDWPKKVAAQVFTEISYKYFNRHNGIGRPLLN